jgi:hypothetical protein
MASAVGRVRSDPIFHIKFANLAYNTIHRAAGGAILNEELLKAEGRMQSSALESVCFFLVISGLRRHPFSCIVYLMDNRRENIFRGDDQCPMNPSLLR